MPNRLVSLVCALVCASALAQNNRSAVSVLGNDANACTVQSPCRAFSKAITVTNSGGEIIALDSGGFGPFTIDRAVTVRPVPGAYAGITVTSGDGISISAGMSDDVILRGITINGMGGSGGISFHGGHSAIIENCSIDRMTSNGITSVSTDGVFISGTTVTGSGSAGIQIGNGGTPVYATIDNCRLAANYFGIAVYQSGNATITNTTLARNSYGLEITTSSPATLAIAMVESCTISGNGIGIQCYSSAGVSAVRASDCTIANNTTGIVSGGAGTSQVDSRSNNNLEMNLTNGSFTGTFGAQ